MADQSSGAAHLSSDTFQQTLDQAGDKPVFVDFYADWCGPCQVAAPIVDKLAGEYADKVMITKLNVDENNELAAKHGVMSIPTVIMFKNGQEVDRKTGFPGEDGYRQMLDSALQA
ncbi:MAG: thioredoxin [Candidatus Pacebacteria bacterium CG10_big_fil_rev_8_21_14_0_10_56_10]|nr:MAG: thioredoxin [Candidatus Pacebacteria bacterium CG10_big_fil_rev_8_21_14_0_10_56_10]